MIVLLYSFGYADRDIWAPDEPRVAEVAREMWNTGSLVPHMNGVPFLEKPFLHYWLVALSYSVFGEANNFSCRFPTLMMAYLTLILTFLFGRELGGRPVGVLSAAFLAGYSLFLQSGHMALLDPSLAFFTLFSVYFFYRALISPTQKGKWQYWLFFLGVSLAFLVKGPIGIVLPSLGAGAFLLYEKKWREMLLLPFWTGMMVPVLFIALWTWILWREGGNSFLHYYYVVNHLKRFTKANLGHKAGPLYYFYTIFGVLGPFLIYLPFVIFWLVKDFKEKLTTGEKYLIFVFLGAFFFLTINSTKRSLYLLPLLPWLALLFGLWVEKSFLPNLKEGKKVEAWLLWGSLSILWVSLVGLLGVNWYFHPEKIALHFLSLGGILTFALWIFFRRKCLADLGLFVFILLFSGFLYGYLTWIGDLNQYKTFVPVMERMKSLTEGKTLMLYRSGELQGNIVPFYLKRTFPRINSLEELKAFQKENPQGYLVMACEEFDQIPRDVRYTMKKVLDFHQGRKSVILVNCSF